MPRSAPFAVVLLAASLPAQEAVPAPPAAAALERATPEARAAWERLCAATGSGGGGPLHAFQLRAEVVRRSGVQNNEGRIEYRYLAPDCIRFMLPSGNETGRFGPAQEQYWLQAGEQVIVLAGREYAEDRRQVDDMCALARNYVALSDPGRLDLRSLELRAGAPADLGPELAKTTKKLVWLALESPDFALVRREGAVASEALYVVELGLRPDGLPGVVVIREKPRAGATTSDPLLVELDRYEERSGFQIPLQLRVHALDPALRPRAFAREPSQEVYVTEIVLQPPLRVDDFKPRKG